MRINLLQLGTEGVDMKTNPLLLGNKKLHAATNIAFDEGVIRTRPGFRYTATRAEGQFQGAGEFRPRLGLSANTLSSVRGGVVIVADGEVWSGCNMLGDGFFCKGDVNVFQAENYLIFQCKEAPTFWWDGMNGLVQSPGMNEQDWNDPETPQQVLETVAPVADIPDCGVEGAEGDVVVTFSVVDSTTEAPVSGALITLFKNGTRAYYGMTDDNGKLVLTPFPRSYTYTVTRDGYTPVEDVGVIVAGTGSEYEWDECVAPMLIVTGETPVSVRIAAIAPPCVPPCAPIAPQCVAITNAHSFITNPLGAYDLSAFFNTPLVPAGLAANMRWRLATDVCGFDRVYSEGVLDETGSLIVAGVVNHYDGFVAGTLQFNSAYDYPEGLILQIGAVGCGDEILWPTRDCIDGYTNPYQ